MRSLKQILVYLKKYKWHVFSSFFFGILCICMTEFQPYIQKIVVDHCFMDGFFGDLPKWCIIYIVVSFSRVWGWYAEEYFAEYAAEYTIYDIRNKMFDHIQRLSFAYHDETEAGQLISRSTADMEAIRMFLMQGLVSVVHFSMFIILSIAFCLSMSWKLSIAVFIIVPIVGVAAWKYSHTIRPLFFKVQDQIGKMTAFLNQNLLGIKVIKSFVREQDQINKFDGLAEKLYDRYIDTSKVSAFYSPLISFLSYIGQICIFVYGGFLALKGQMTVGSVVAFISYFSLLLGPINSISMYVALIQNASASGDRIFEVLRRRPEKITDGHIVMNSTDGNVEFKNVSFSYSDGFNALENINFTAVSGALIGIIGATGSGKTTLINLLSRFYDVTEGEILIDGINIKDYTLDSLRRHVGIVAQESFLFGDTIKANISYPKNASDEEIVEAAKAANIHDYIMSLPDGYDTIIGERGVDLSGGQKQRMSIARALLLNPDILVLDDSTSALDTQTESLIQAAIKNVSTQRTTFMIAQRVSAIVNADIILVLDEGKIVEMGTHRELIDKNGYYKKIFDSQLLAKKGGEE